MKTIIVFILSVSIPLAIAAAVMGFYPVAFVGTEPILYRTWQKAEEAAKKFTNVNIQSSLGGKPIDFNSTKSANLLLEVRRGALTFLIEDVILEQEGAGLIDGFKTLSRERVDEAKRGIGEDQLQKAAKLAYELSLKDFENLVLMPQARRDVLIEALSEKQQDFDSWLAEAKKKKNVRLFFVPFRWNGEVVR